MQDQIVPYIIDIKDDLNETFINYEYIKELYDNEFEAKRKISINHDKRNRVDKYLNVFLLAHFIENIIATKVKRNIHGIDVFIKMINEVNKNMLIPKYNDSNFILALYSEINKTLNSKISNKFNAYKVDYFTKT
ncbi:hypothetical protein, partial [Clostridium novyi]|uniref:hypothetical protein n=1 Tax=Clostridium novyi TaxID=1542 RepID=UPI00057FAECD